MPYHKAMYEIDGTTSKHPEQSEGAYTNDHFWPTFQQDIAKFKTLLVEHRDTKKPFSVIRLGHAEFTCFSLTCGAEHLKVGDGKFDFFTTIKSAPMPDGGRHSNGHIPDIREFCNYFESLINSDYVTTQIGYDFKNWLNTIEHYKNCYIAYKHKGRLEQLFNDRSIFQTPKCPRTIQQLMDMPLDIIYGLIANKWLLTTFKNRIGLIGAAEKLKCIKELMEYDEYKEYLGNDYFTDYIHIPQRAALSWEHLEDHVEQEVKKSDCDIFLIGMGCAKLNVFHPLKDMKDCIFLDVGHSIDLLAGWGDIMRPYCGSWQNYRVEGFSGEDIDEMGIDRGEIKYLR